jgi:hypothetical protein
MCYCALTTLRRQAGQTLLMSGDPSPAQLFTRDLAEQLADAELDIVVGVYLHGSAVLGDWIAEVSDVDVLVVVADGVSSDSAQRLAEVLAASPDCPGVGIEASVVKASAAAVPSAPWPFVIHVSTVPRARKTVWATSGRGDSDLILHYAVTRAWGWPAHGPSPEKLFGEIPHSIVVHQLADELRWAVTHADESYAILNACRALRFGDERVLCSKTDGGNWALVRDIQPALVQRALDARHLGRTSPTTESTREWILAVAADLSS